MVIDEDWAALFSSPTSHITSDQYADLMVLIQVLGSDFVLIRSLWKKNVSVISSLWISQVLEAIVVHLTNDCHHTVWLLSSGCPLYVNDSVSCLLLLWNKHNPCVLYLLITGCLTKVAPRMNSSGARGIAERCELCLLGWRACLSLLTGKYKQNFWDF